MQIAGICQAESNTNFKMLNPKYAGIYKKHPEYAEKLYDAFKQNEKAVKFCDDFNGRVVFYASKSGYNMIESSLNIFYDNPAMSRLKRFWKALSSSEPNIKLFSWGRSCFRGESTQDLIRKIKPNKDGRSLLGTHIDYERNRIGEDLQIKRSRDKFGDAKRVLTELSE